jgi:hypothetical protein
MPEPLEEFQELPLVVVVVLAGQALTAQQT